jgi:hypothetical protein
MTIDVAKLREQLEASFHKPPWRVYPPTDPWGAGIGARDTKYTIGSFEFGEDDQIAVAAVNALPRLLDEVERLRALEQVARGVVYVGTSSHHMCDIDERIGELVTALAAVDASRKQAE